MTTPPAPDRHTDSLDAVFAEFLLQREREPDLLPVVFAARLPREQVRPFLAEVDVLTDVERLSAAPPAGLPERIGRYRILAKLGSGGTGVVYEAEQVALGRRVAVKVLHRAGRDGSDDDALTRFAREARLVAALHHESIVAVHDFDEHDGAPVLVMQLAPGTSLHILLAARRSASHALHPTAVAVLGDPRRVVRTFAKIADALAYAHDRGVVHRDFKPANVMVDDHGHPTVLDFGLARSVDVDRAVTRRGEVLGTPLYMAPEQLVGETAGPAADLWALGSVLHECLTGHAAAGPRAAPHHDVPAELRRLVDRCRERDPARRPASAAELAAGLRSFADRRPATIPRAVRRVLIATAAAAVCIATLAAVPARRMPKERSPQPSVEERLQRLESAVLAVREDAGRDASR